MGTFFGPSVPVARSATVEESGDPGKGTADSDATFNDDSFTETAYDDFGRIIAETNQVGQTRTFDYDSHGRLVAVVLPDTDTRA